MPLKRLLALLLSAALLLPALYACSEQTEESGDVSRSAGTDADALAQVQHYLDYYKEHPFTSYREVAAVYALGVSFDGYDLSALEPDEIDRLENYALTWRIRGGAWKADFTGHPDGYGQQMDEDAQQRLDEINLLRHRAAAPFAALQDALLL